MALMFPNISKPHNKRIPHITYLWSLQSDCWKLINHPTQQVSSEVYVFITPRTRINCPALLTDIYLMTLHLANIENEFRTKR